MAYKVIFSRQSEKVLSKFSAKDKKLAAEIIDRIEKLGSNPFLGIPLRGMLKGYFKIRVGDYRVVYEFAAKLGTVYIEKIGHRREIYK